MVLCYMDRIELLLSKYLANEASEEEIQELLRILRENEQDMTLPGEDGGNEALLEELWKEHVSREQPSPTPPASLQRMWMQIEASTAPLQKTYFLRRHWQSVAAILILLVAGAWFLLVRHRPVRVNSLAAPAVAVRDAAPGRNGAILTLADGTQKSLDSAVGGLIADQNGARLVLQNSRLEYEKTGKPSGELTYNTITTPKGRQFRLMLPDGSRVWLNAASSIKFPTVFKDGERRVEIAGEAYFEVVKDKNKPFVVHTLQTETEVLGTSFDINAYQDEEMLRATLLEGSIRTSALRSGQGEDKALLRPGEQVQVRPDEKMTILRHADLDQVLSWKNGVFNFQNASLKEVMRQLARWYDLEIVYEKNVPDIRFGGEMSMNVPLSDLLKGLKDMEVHFRIEEGRRLIVMP